MTTNMHPADPNQIELGKVLTAMLNLDIPTVRSHQRASQITSTLFKRTPPTSGKFLTRLHPNNAIHLST